MRRRICDSVRRTLAFVRSNGETETEVRLRNVHREIFVVDDALRVICTDGSRSSYKKHNVDVDNRLRLAVWKQVLFSINLYVL